MDPKYRDQSTFTLLFFIFIFFIISSPLKPSFTHTHTLLDPNPPFYPLSILPQRLSPSTSLPLTLYPYRQSTPLLKEDHTAIKIDPRRHGFCLYFCLWISLLMGLSLSVGHSVHGSLCPSLWVLQA